MKVYVDDTREAPEGWHLCNSFYSAYEFITKHYEEITHIDFDYYLSEKNTYQNGNDLIRELLWFYKDTGKNIFHQPKENYTFHSSDSYMNEKMRETLYEFFDRLEVKVEHKRKLESVSKLDRLRKSKGRR